jgi:hypothetical protein
MTIPAGPMTIETLKERHTKLYDKALEEAPKLRRALNAIVKGDTVPDTPQSNEREAFLAEVNDLLENLSLLSAQVRSFEDYRWLSHAAVKWQNVFGFLDMPAFVKVLPPSEGLRLPPAETTPAGTQDAALSKEELGHWLKTHAEFFAFTRMARLRRFSTQEEMDDDRHMAFVYLASDILDGKINLVKRIPPESYGHLDLVWMEDLKHLRAYLLWLERGGGFGLSEMKKNYFDVCDHLRKMLTDETIKAPVTAFEPIRRYLVETFLTAGKIDAERNENAGWLVGHKAYRLYDKTRKAGREENWIHAEAYVKTFYENIISAVLDGDPESTLCVLRAFQCDSGVLRPAHQIINAFEAALATYFLRPALIQRIWNDCEANPSLNYPSIISEINANDWPSHFQVPANCARLFEVVNGMARFRGVMLNAQKEALQSGLRAEHRQLVEALYKRTRTVCRESTL